MTQPDNTAKRHTGATAFLYKAVAWGAFLPAMLVLMGSTCPTYEPPPPPVPGAPVITHTEITGYLSPSSRMVRPAVHLRWMPSPADSIGIQSFTILRRTGDDSSFSTLRRSIPRDITRYHDITDGITVAEGTYLPVYYRVFAVDSLGRNGDTSAVDTVELANPARLMSPLDTLRDPVFKWAIMGTMSVFYTYMCLWDSLGLRWQSPLPSEPTFLSDYQVDSTSVRLPDSLIPLHQGTYFWGAKMDILNGRRTITTGSMAIGSFYVP